MAALREAHEEIGLPPQSVEILGTLPAHETVTGFNVTPVVGLVEPGYRAVPDLQEVAEIFEIPAPEFKSIRSRFVPDATPDPYMVLGVTPDTPLDASHIRAQIAARDGQLSRAAASDAGRNSGLRRDIV